MIYLTNIPKENVERAMLISLILILGVILYFKLIKSLNAKRLSQSYVAVSGYDLIGEKLEIRYSIPSALDSLFTFTNDQGEVILTAPFNHELGGDFVTLVPLNGFKEEKLVYLNFQNEKQKISKKIYLNI